MMEHRVIFFAMFFYYFHCIWRKIRGHLRKLSIVWGIFCIVFIQVVAIKFYLKSCNFMAVLSIFSEKSCKSEKQNITWRIEDMTIEDQSFRRSLKSIQVEENSFQIPRQFKTEERSKKGRNCKIRKGATGSFALHMNMLPCTWGSSGYCLMRPCASSHAPCACLTCRKRCLLVFKVGSMEKFQSYSLNP